MTPAPARTNVPALISLICGIVGCFIITPVIGIITGIIGLAKAKVVGGRGMAIAGIILSVLWIVGGIAVVGGTYWGVNKIAGMAKQPAIDTINALVDGDIAKARGLSVLSEDEARAMSDQLKSYGKCTDLSVSGLNSSNNNGTNTISVTGTATFEKAGNKSFSAEATDAGGTLKVTKLGID
ncbi:MAG TPA: DUF4190 domain-containing protein [Tepidisphaeraceae bacterium]|jgi:hypothetical protein